ncbi:MAG: sugar ABC transporter permease [Bacillota bacterium]|jgi:raffinose/stachyose/melibiose transport system permease protein|nr:sugar ABC transporter permease [Bacillota bacterium]NLJ02948.1 sugar ABC transporter permease [Bacillota bacterium]
MAIYSIFFLLPTLLSFFFSLTVWDLQEWRFVGLLNFKMFFEEPALRGAVTNTLIYAVTTSGLKTVLALLIAVGLASKLPTRNFLRSMIFFPTIVSTVAVGIVFTSLMHPTRGVLNAALAALGISGPDWLGNGSLALYSVILVDVWRGIGMAMMIYLAGLSAIPEEYGEALMVDGGNAWDKFRHITLPLIRPSMNSVIILSFIGGLRSFDLIWAMTGGGPGFATEILSSIVYKQYISGFYGLSTAGNIILLVLVALLAVPLHVRLTKMEVDL